tara:strand:+ start:65 stop:481 length:417 start_codon:yes stop_codon:yes gene_type:complete
MAVVINRTLMDGASMASFEVVSTGGSSEAETIVDVSGLSGASDDGTDRVRVKQVTALVCGDASSGETNVRLIWAGSGDTFLTLPYGTTDINITCWPTIDSTGDITFASTDNTPFTLRLLVEKTNGFVLSTTKFNSLNN